MEEDRIAHANTPELIAAMERDEELTALRRQIYPAFAKYRYTYNFTWLGRPIIQLPQDIVMVQELIWRVRPDLIVETGVAHGGSLVLSATILEILGRGEVVGVDIEIRPHNRAAIEQHPLAHRIRLVEGSSIDAGVVAQVRAHAAGKQRVMVFLDSNHTHEHVARELELYAGLVRAGSYLVVFDTGVEHMPADMFPDRPWGPGNNPLTAVREFLAKNDRFVVDRELESRLMFTVAPEGYLRCVKD
jgi:cephalosporin hydroxylase